MSSKQLFLSCVSSEFRTYRETLRHDLNRPDVAVKIQEDFVAFGTDTLCKLNAYIRHCEAVIHIVGDMTGASAGNEAVNALLCENPDLAHRLPPLKSLCPNQLDDLPYTQWEAWLALYHGKRLLIACPTAEAPRDAEFVGETRQKDIQQEHLARLAQVRRYPEITFANADRLAVEILRSPIGPGYGVSDARICELPLRNPNFSGRQEWLDKLEASLSSRKPVVVAQAVVGLGGIGKTQLVLEFAHRCVDKYEIVWWVRAETDALRDEDLLGLHRRMALPASEDESVPDRLATLRRALEATSRWLLVFDNVERQDILRDILPRVGNGHVLVTSRLRNWMTVAVEVTLPVWSSAESLDYLQRRTGSERDAALEDIAKELDHLPLALEQAAAYMVESRVSSAAYLGLLRRANSKPLDVQGASAIATTWNVSILAVRERSPQALTLLEFLAFMPPDDISRAALIAGSGISMPHRLATVLRDEVTLNSAVAVLRSFSLVEASHDRLQVHRLVQLVVSERLAAKDYRAFDQVARRFRSGWTQGAPESKLQPTIDLRRRRIVGAVGGVAIAGVAGGVGYALYKVPEDKLFRDGESKSSTSDSPLSLSWLPEVLEEAGLKVAEVPGWLFRGRGDVGKIRGVMCHHTAGPSNGNMPSLKVLTEGMVNLPGPLAQLGIGRDGTFYLIAAGRALHAGQGIWEGISTGNDSFIGIDAENSGRSDDPWPTAQLDAFQRGVAAILKKIGASSIMCCGHKEYAKPPGRKNDPTFDMTNFRAQVARMMA